MTASEEATSPDRLHARFWVWPLVFLVTWAGMLLIQNPTIAAGDSGETVAAVSTLGVSHPPGHPLGELLGRLALALSIGTAAFRVNLLSSLAALFAALLLGDWTRKKLIASGSSSGWPVWLFSLLAFMTLVLNPSVLEQALTAKGGVYTLSLLWMVCLLRSVSFEGQRTARDLASVFFWEGLAFATHWPTALAGSALAAVWIWESERWSLRDWALAGMALFMGLSTYLMLPIRALANPGIDWGHPVSWNSFLWVVSRANYSEMESSGRNWADILRQVGVVGKALLLSFPWAFLAVVGYGVWGKFSIKEYRAYIIAMAVPALAIAVVPTLHPETYYLVSTYLTAFLGLWVFLAIVGLVGAFQWLSTRSRLAVFCFLLLFSAGGVWFSLQIPRWNAARQLIAHDIGVNVLQALPKDAVIMAEGDTYVLSLLHAQYTENLRPDVTVVPTVFLNGSWGFDQTMKKIHPSHIPVFPPATFSERVGFLSSLGVPVIGDAERVVFVSTANGAFQKANLGSYVQLEPWGLSYRLVRQESDPLMVRARVWQQARIQRCRGSFDGRAEVAKDKRNRELYGYYANPFILSGNALQKSGRYLEASDDYARALSILPESAEAYSNLAAVAGASGLQELAQTFCRMSLAVDPNYAGAWDNLGNVFALQGLWDDALDAYDRALKEKPDSPGTQANRDRAFQSQKEGRIGTVQRHDVKWYMDLGVSYYNQQRWVMASGVFETVLETGMNTSAVWSDIGVVRAQLGDRKGARHAFEESLRLNSKFIETYKNFALLDIQEGKREEARELLEKGLAIQPNQAEIGSLLSSLNGPEPEK